MDEDFLKALEDYMVAFEWRGCADDVWEQGAAERLEPHLIRLGLRTRIDERIAAGKAQGHL